MLYQNLLPAFVALVRILGVSARPQVTAVIPFGILNGDGEVDPSGEDAITGVIAGTGPDGTTYVLFVPATAADDMPLTVTLVENASGVNAVVAFSEADLVVTQTIGCGLDGDSAVCTQVLIGADGTETLSTAFTTSGTPDSLTVVVSTANAADSSFTISTQISQSITAGPSPTTVDKGTATVSTNILSTSGSATDSASTSGSTQSSSAGKNSVMGALTGTIVLALIAIVMT